MRINRRAAGLWVCKEYEYRDIRFQQYRFLGRSMDKKVFMLLTLVLLGAIMISVAAIAGKTGDTSSSAAQPMVSQASRDLVSSYQDQYIERILSTRESQDGFSSLASQLAMLQALRNYSSINVSISRTTINGTLVFIENNIAIVKSDQKLLKIIIPDRLFDGERVSALQDLIFTGEIKKGDSLSIKAINISISSKESGLIASIYLALEINDLTTGKNFIALIPINW
ncbi:MAG: hypothetical protein DJ555_00230 [Desulfurococcaceae archaeon]|nr:MAG: hypothetical protein DJ555_00230 [Desulfurococcaceae archaeon]